MPYGLPDASFDQLTKCPTVVQTDHRYVHSGIAYAMTHSVAAGTTTIYIGITTPNAARNDLKTWADR